MIPFEQSWAKSPNYQRPMVLVVPMVQEIKTNYTEEYMQEIQEESYGQKSPLIEHYNKFALLFYY